MTGSREAEEKRWSDWKAGDPKGGREVGGDYHRSVDGARGDCGSSGGLAWVAASGQATQVAEGGGSNGDRAFEGVKGAGKMSQMLWFAGGAVQRTCRARSSAGSAMVV
jgi:hypothetical protein